MANITRSIVKETSKDGEGEIWHGEKTGLPAASEVKLQMGMAISSQRKQILETITQIKADDSAQREREADQVLTVSEKLENAIKKHGIQRVKAFVQHLQNKEVINYLDEYKKSLGDNKHAAGSLVSAAMRGDDQALSDQARKLLANLQRWGIIVNCVEAHKVRTDKFVQSTVYPIKKMVEDSSLLIGKYARELMVKVQAIKSVQYLQRKLYIQAEPFLFPREREKELFQNSSFYNARLRTLSKKLCVKK